MYIVTVKIQVVRLGSRHWILRWTAVIDKPRASVAAPTDVPACLPDLTRPDVAPLVTGAGLVLDPAGQVKTCLSLILLAEILSRSFLRFPTSPAPAHNEVIEPSCAGPRGRPGVAGLGRSAAVPAPPPATLMKLQANNPKINRLRSHHHRLPCHQLRRAADRTLFPDPSPQQRRGLPGRRRHMGRLDPLHQMGPLYRRLPLHRRQGRPSA